MSGNGNSNRTRSSRCNVKSFMRYETGRQVRFHAPVVALCYRLIQALILTYIGGYVLYHEKGYQQFEQGISSVVAKVKGNQKGSGGLTWDAADVIIPPLENNALFITTAVVFTPKQRPGICAEIDVVGARCFYNHQCKVGEPVLKGNGFMTGMCNATTATCEVSAWCPLENSKRSTIRLYGGENHTILVKNFILFPRNKVKRRNIGDELTTEYLRSCAYHPDTDPFCPIFVLGDIVNLAGENFTSMARYGAILSFGIEWDCDLDLDLSHCRPKYSFRRLDDSKDTNFPGWNFRHTGYWDENGSQQRALIKSTGIRIVFSVYAQAGKFAAVKATLVLGSSLGLLGLASMLCDYILFNCSRPETLKRRRNATTLDDEQVENTPDLHRGRSYYFQSTKLGLDETIMTR